MYRQLEDSGEPTKKQAFDKSIRLRAARKQGKTGRMSLRSARWTTTGHDLLGGQ
jgi:hypothetical protein